MSYMQSESEADIIPASALAVMALVAMFMVSSINVTWKQVDLAVEPVRAQVASLREQGGEVVYALAVYTGVVPEEESAFAYVSIPVNHHEDFKRAPQPQVAGAYSTRVLAEASYTTPSMDMEDIPTTPWLALYEIFAGQ